MIIGYYAGLLGLLLVFLTLRIVRLRWKYKIGIGDGGEHALSKAIRVHSNFIEYVPLALLLIYMVEMQQTSLVLMHGLGSALFIARVLHVFGLSKTSQTSFGRTVGTILTLLVLAISAGLLIFGFVRATYVM
jgi:uncharacterized membrane protein YecN with MAPEG domain|tara:strand:- start:22 stop:417 length:396 start_codon:yes stop_codon:yes gene_type:complete